MRLKYKKIPKSIPKFLSKFEVKIKTIVPEPTPVDYQRGFIVRYFIQKVNDKNSPVFEVSDTTYKNYVDNTLYLNCSIEWKISGTDDEIKKSNESSLIRLYDKMPALRNYLYNLLQFKEKKNL